jgi:predicted extracellular nuclease
LVGATAAATVVAGLGFAGAVPAGAATGDPVLLNEILASTDGTDPEYVELFGEPGTSLAGLSVIEVESDAGSSNGAIDHRYDLGADDVIGENGFFLLANPLAESTYGVTADYSFEGNGLENSSATYALVETSSISGSTTGEGIVVLDAVAASDGEEPESFAFGAPVVGPDGSFFPAGVGRVDDGADTDESTDWSILSFDNDPSVNTPTSATTVVEHDGNNPDRHFIHEVQGDGDESPMVGERVVVEGVVVGDEEGGYPTLHGFFVQEEEADADDDPDTSEGIFVYNGNNDDVRPGDVVQVEGTVDERFGNTQLTDDVRIVVLGNQARPVTPASVEFPLDRTSDLEAVEGMAARFPQELVVTEYFNYDRFGEVVVALPMKGEERPFTPTAVADPYSDAAEERAEWNRLSRITIDDGLTAQNPSRVVHPINREPFTLENRFRGGDQVTDLVGPIYFDFGIYRVLPTGFGDYDRTERPESPEAVGGELTVASMNTLNYFLTLDDGSPDCGPAGDMDCRGANTSQELERQRVKLLNALEGLEADVIALNELENTAGVRPLADIVAGLNKRLGAGTYDYVRAGQNAVVGTDAIKVGLIYKPASVKQVGRTAVLDSKKFLDPNDTGQDKNRAAVAASFRDRATGEVFSVTANHLKSKGSSCGAGDDDFWADSCNKTRTLAAQELAAWLDTNPTTVNDDDWMIIGDLNSYDHEDPIKALRSKGFTDLVREHVGELAYSYVFDGEWGYLDYAMSSSSLTGQVTGATEWHINSDEPDILDYDMSFKSAAQDALFDPTTPYRSSDHDAVLVGLDLG